jgi:polyferredoxin
MLNIKAEKAGAIAIGAGVKVKTDGASATVSRRRKKIRQLLLSAVFMGVIIGGWFFPVLGYFIPVCMVAGIAIGVSKGRKWCGTLCPRGAFYDALVKPISPGKRIPDVFKRLPLRIAVLSFLMAMLTYQIIVRWPDPVSIGRFFVMLLTITTGVGLVLAKLFQERTWCYVCPIGTLTKWTGGERHQVQVAPSCVDCKLCAKACPMQISPNTFKEHGAVKDADCVKCSSCVTACPKKALSLPS